MAAVHSRTGKEPVRVPEADSQTSSVPLLREGQSDDARSSTAPSQEGDYPIEEETAEATPKAGKRRFWGLGKKSDEEKTKSKSQQTSEQTGGAHISPITTMRPVSPLRPAESVRGSASPQRIIPPYGSPSSPGQHPYSSSPRLHSPASSQIFERSVQDEIPPQASPHLPSHIITENHIPPVLEASSAAITDKELDPDTVEIVTSTLHQPASLTVTGAGLNDQSMSSSWVDDQSAHPDMEDSASNYGSLDTNDVRRLSFISFADVVHAEHAEHSDIGDHLTSRDSLQTAPVTSQPTLAAARSPSPVRSPVSSHGRETSPPTSVSPSFRAMDASPSRGSRGAGSPLPAHSPPLGGELNIETMRQALRKTGSGDLSGARSQPMSAVGNDEGINERSFR